MCGGVVGAQGGISLLPRISTSRLPLREIECLEREVWVDDQIPLEKRTRADASCGLDKGNGRVGTEQVLTCHRGHTIR